MGWFRSFVTWWIDRRFKESLRTYDTDFRKIYGVGVIVLCLAIVTKLPSTKLYFLVFGTWAIRWEMMRVVPMWLVVPESITKFPCQQSFEALKKLVMEYLLDMAKEYDALGLSKEVSKFQNISISSFFSLSNSKLFEFSWLGFSSQSVIFTWPPCCLDCYYLWFLQFLSRDYGFPCNYQQIFFICLGFLQWVYERLSLLFGCLDTYPLS